MANNFSSLHLLFCHSPLLPFLNWPQLTAIMSTTKLKLTTKPPIISCLTYCCILQPCTPWPPPAPSPLPAATPLTVSFTKPIGHLINVVGNQQHPINPPQHTLPNPLQGSGWNTSASSQPSLPPGLHLHQAPPLDATSSTAVSLLLAKTTPAPWPPSSAPLFSPSAPCPHKTPLGSATPHPPLPCHYFLNQNPLLVTWHDW